MDTVSCLCAFRARRTHFSVCVVLTWFYITKWYVWWLKLSSAQQCHAHLVSSIMVAGIIIAARNLVGIIKCENGTANVSH